MGPEGSIPSACARHHVRWVLRPVHRLGGAPHRGRHRQHRCPLGAPGSIEPSNRAFFFKRTFFITLQTLHMFAKTHTVSVSTRHAFVGMDPRCQATDDKPTPQGGLPIYSTSRSNGDSGVAGFPRPTLVRNAIHCHCQCHKYPLTVAQPIFSKNVCFSFARNLRGPRVDFFPLLARKHARFKETDCERPMTVRTRRSSHFLSSPSLLTCTPHGIIVNGYAAVSEAQVNCYAVFKITISPSPFE